jgi:hypothetical protein
MASVIKYDPKIATMSRIYTVVSLVNWFVSATTDLNNALLLMTLKHAEGK